MDEAHGNGPTWTAWMGRGGRLHRSRRRPLAGNASSSSSCCFELAVEQLVVGSGEARWLPTANRRLERALETGPGGPRLPAAMESDAPLRAAETFARPAPLADIAAGRPAAPGDAIFIEHRQALLELGRRGARERRAQPAGCLIAAGPVRPGHAGLDRGLGSAPYDATRRPAANDFDRPSRPGTSRP